MRRSEVKLNLRILLTVRRGMLLLFLFQCFSIANSSVPDTSDKIRSRILYGFYQHGWVLPTNQFIRGNNQKQEPVVKYRALSLYISWQTNGSKLWEQLYKYPKFAFGIYKPLFPDAPYLGKPIGIYGSMGFALKRWETTTFYFEPGFGMVFNWISFMEDRYNLALGASESIMFSTTFSFEKRLTKDLKGYIGAGFVHFSNGSLKVPNLGINVFTPKLGLGYNFNGPEKKFIYREVPDFKRESEYYISVFTGWRNIQYYGEDVDSTIQRRGVYYNCYGLSFSYNYQISHMSKLGVGIMTDYLGYVNSSITSSNGRLYPNPASFKDGFEISIYPSYELVINRATIILQPGFYLHRGDYPEKTPFNYQRIGMKYYLSRNISMGINMRAHYWSIADFIEWNIGYSFR